MKMDLRGPCSNCPFRNDIEPYISRARMEEIIQAITVGDQNFACHKTTDSDGDGERFIGERSQHCGGAMVFLAKVGRENQMMRMAMRLGILDSDSLKMDAPVFGDLAEVRRKFAGRRARRAA